MLEVRFPVLGKDEYLFGCVEICPDFFGGYVLLGRKPPIFITNFACFFW